MTSVNYIKDDSGTFIPSSQRPDGTWRRPIRVKDGYVPQEEQPLYVSKGKQGSSYRPDYPVGMTEGDVASYRSSSNNSSSTQGNKGGSLYFDVGLYTPAPVATPIPGLNFVETPESEKPSSKKKKSKSKSKQVEESTGNMNGGKKPGNNQASSGPSTNSSTAVATTTDPVKRLRNLRKRLKDIETLEKKIDAGELENPEKEQLEKIKRKDDVLDEIDDLEKLIDRLGLS